MCAYVRMRRDCVRKHRVVSHQWLWGRTPSFHGLDDVTVTKGTWSRGGGDLTEREKSR